MAEKINIKDLSPEDIEGYFTSQGLEPYRARQIGKWLYQKDAESFDDMTNLSKELRESLKETFELKCAVELSDEQLSVDGTRKFLFELNDGKRIESVLIPEKSRNTLCVSSQVGCALACKFCLTGTIGKIRNLSPSEIVDQYILVNRYSGGSVTNIVFMGMGEPLDNLDNLIKALKILMDEHYIALSAKRITVSTSGLVPKIRELGKEVSVNLAVSLNAPRDDIRDEIMPINKRYPIKELLRESVRFPLPPRKDLMFEYVMLKGVNDSIKDAHDLGELLKGIRCKINLIPFNEAMPLSYHSPSREGVLAFQKVLMSYGINVRIRKSRGTDILGACGQLAASYPARSPEAKTGPVDARL